MALSMMARRILPLAQTRIIMKSITNPPKRYIGTNETNTTVPQSNNAEELLKRSEAILKDSKDDVVGLCQKGVALHSLGRYQEAAAALEKVQGIVPANIEIPALAALAESYYQCDRFNDAVRVADDVLKVGPDEHITSLMKTLKANSHYMSNNDELALKSVEEAIETDKDNSRLHYLKGVLLIQQNDPKNAIGALNKAVRMEPKNSLYQYERGRALRAMKDYDAAIAALKKAIDLDKTNATAYNLWGICLSESNKQEEAITAWTQGLEHNKEDTSLLSNIGRGLFGLNRAAESADYLRKALQHLEEGPEKKSVRIAFAECLLHLNYYTEALEVLDEHIKYFDNDGMAYALRSQALRSLDHIPSALEAIERACHIDPNRVQWQFMKAVLLHRNIRDKEAIEVLNHCLEKAPTGTLASDMLSTRGLVYMRGLKQVDRAIEDFDQALLLSRNHYHALMYKAFAFDEKREYTKALELWDKVVENPAADAQSHVNRGKCLSKLDKKEEALKSFDKAIEIHPNDLESYKAKGATEWQMGLVDNAYQTWEKGAQVDDDDVQIHFLLAVCHYHRDELQKALNRLDKAFEVGQEQGVPLEVMELRKEIEAKIKN